MDNQIDLLKQPTQLQKQSPISLPPADWIKNDTSKEIFLANFHRKLSDLGDDVNDVAAIINLLTEWSMHVGVVTTPHELQFCRQFLILEYGDWSIEKIRLAIKYSLKGELKVDIKPYGAFSTLYISTILNAYAKFEEKIISSVLREKNKLDMQHINEPVPLSGKDKIESRRQYLQWYINMISNGDSYKPDYNSVMWNFITKNGFINPDNQHKKYCRKYADMMLKRVKDPFEIALTTADEWEQYMRFKLHKIFFRYLRMNLKNEVLIQKLQDITDKQIML